MYRLTFGVARTLAIMGGLVLGALILLTCLSVLGREVGAFLSSDWAQRVIPDLAATLRATGIGPINGDFELVQGGVAFAIFAFLPLCQISAGHATVDVFTNRLPDRVVRVLRALAEVAFAVVLILIAHRLWAGMLGKMGNGETTFILEWPVWQFYALSLAGAIAAALVAVYTASVRVAEAAVGTDLIPWGGGDHD